MNTVPLVSKLLVVVLVLGLVSYGVLFFTWPIASLFPLQAVVWIGVVPLTLEVLIKLFQKDFGADLLAVLALITSLLLHEYLAGSLIVLMLAGGQVLEQFAVRKASSVLNALAQRMPHTAHRQVDNEIEEVSLSDIVIGDKLVIFPHETTPVDGKVCEGNGHMDESYLTGEPYRVAKAPGSQVLSGAINGDAVLVIEAEKPVADSRYATIMKVMQEAENKRPALRRLGDQIGAIFTPVALLIACGAWFFTGDSSRFLSVLMVATPCPLLIAIPITIISAISLAAKQGIIIRDPAVLERLPTCRTAIFDKTGTLTYGDPTLTEILPHPPFDTKTLLQAAASLERYSKHPLANAFIERANAEHLVLPQASEVSEKPGQGLFGVINGQPWHLTSRQKIAANWPHLLALLPPVSLGLECVILCHDQYAGVFRLRDEARAEGKSFIGHLAPAHQLNKVILLSGDRASEVAYLAETLGIQETFAEQSPEEKVAIVRQETALAPTLFMGDGINDAPALATATVGLAFGSHNSVTSEAAGAVILENTLHKVDELLHISLALRRIAMQSAVGGMILSLIGMGLATVGLLSPVEGALAQEAIDVLAILNALRLAWQPTIVTDMAHHET
ncbi:MAG: heavy metal translocating P-type ATPase [Vampirovibrio sp.]